MALITVNLKALFTTHKRNFPPIGITDALSVLTSRPLSYYACCRIFVDSYLLSISAE